MLEEVIRKLVEETVRATLNEISIERDVVNNAIMDTKEVAKYIGMSTAWVYQNLDMLPHRKIRKKLIFQTDEINAFLNERKEKNNECKISGNAKIKKTENGKYKVV